MIKKILVNLFIAIFILIAVGDAYAQQPVTDGNEIRYDEYQLTLIINEDGSIKIKFDDGTVSVVPSIGEKVMGLFITNPTYPALNVQYQTRRITAGLGLSISHRGVKGWGTDYEPWEEVIPALRSLQTDEYLCIVTYRVLQDAYGSIGMNVWVKSDRFADDGNADSGVGCGRSMEITANDLKLAFAEFAGSIEFYSEIENPKWLINAAGTNCIWEGESYTGVYNNQRIFELTQIDGEWEFTPLGETSEEYIEGTFDIIEYNYYGGSCTAVQEQR